MTIRNIIINLNEIYTNWSELEKTKQVQTINHIFSIIQLTSYLQQMIALKDDHEDETLDRILLDFSKFYQDNFYNTDITKTAASDFTAEIFNQIEKITKYKTCSEEELLDLQNELLNYQNKYEHAHARIFYNFGQFYKIIFSNLSQENKDKIINQLRLEEFNEETLRKLDKAFELEKNSSFLRLDDLENHALLNQITNFRIYLRKALNIAIKDELKTEFIAFIKQNHTHDFNATPLLEKSESKIDQEITIYSRDLKEKFESELKVGIESEFTLTPLTNKSGSVNIVNKEDNPVNINIALKEIFTDLDARAKKQEEYKKSSIISNIEQILFFKQIEKDDTEKQSNFRKFDLFLIKKDLENAGYQECDIIFNLIESLSPIEIYFYKLLIIEENQNISIDDVVDANKYCKDTNQEKIINKRKRIVSLIKEGKLHEKLFDMIHANEVSFGPDKIEDILPKLRTEKHNLNLHANKMGLSFNEANIQLNLSLEYQGKNVLLPEIHTLETDDKIVKLNALAIEFFRTIQEIIVDQSTKHKGLIRDQEEIAIRVDLKKGLLKELTGTDYIKLDEKAMAFLEHKKIAAKDATMRISKADSTNGVVEIRLIGNNPHFAFSRFGSQIHNSGLDYIPEILLPEIAKKINEKFSSLGKERIAELAKKYVVVQYDGSIKELPPLEVCNIQDQEVIPKNKKPLSILRKQTSSGKSFEFEDLLSKKNSIYL